MTTGKPILTRGAPFLAILVLGCAADVDTSAIRASLDADAIEITYYEKSSSMDVVVKIAEFEHAFAVEMQVDVTIPDGTTQRHDLGWTHGDPEIPWIEVPAIANGRYDVALTHLSIDGRRIEGPTVHQRMEILGVRGGGELLAECGPGEVIEGTEGPDSLLGTEGRDIMFGHEGDDSLHGLACGDILHGGKGGDDLQGNEGNDVLLGDEGDDVCRGGPGLDTFGSCEVVLQD